MFYFAIHIILFDDLLRLLSHPQRRVTITCSNRTNLLFGLKLEPTLSYHPSLLYLFHHLLFYQSFTHDFPYKITCIEFNLLYMCVLLPYIKWNFINSTSSKLPNIDINYIISGITWELLFNCLVEVLHGEVN